MKIPTSNPKYARPMKPLGANRWPIVLGLLAILTILPACNGGAQADEEGTQFQIREPRATFTPTVLPEGGAATDQNAAAQNGAGAADSATTQSGSQSAAPGTAGTTADSGSETDSAASDGAAESDQTTVSADPNFAGRQATITSSLVNGRGGPGTDFDVIGVVAEGEIFDVLGQNNAGDWWQLCCYLGDEFWVINDFVDVDQGSAIAAQPAQPAQPAPTNTPAPAAQQTAAPAAPAQPDAPDQPDTPNDFAFDLVVQEQFGETSVVRIFLYVFSDQIQALEGYTLKVTKDGAELPIGTKSYGPQAGYTWPVSTTRQRFENMKIEFPGEAPAGNWTVQLADGSGNLVGPPATFELSGNEPNQELYVRYKEK